MELVRSENATATVRLIRRVCQTHGTFDRLYTDNGAAFAGKQVAGGTKGSWRKGTKQEDGKTITGLGICKVLGIEPVYALPKNAQAKIVERVFATMSRRIDDRPEFAGAHTGHGPGDAPAGDVVPVPLDVALAVLTREVERYNRERGRRGHGMRGRSHQEVLDAGLALRVRRVPTKDQLYLAGLEWRRLAVDSKGCVHVDGWTYGDPTSQAALLPFHKAGKVPIGRDPDDFEAPAIAYDDAGRMICKGIEPVKRGAYGSIDGARTAARNRKATREAVALAEKSQAWLADAEFTAAMRDLNAAIALQMGEAPAAPPSGNVVAGQFGGALSARAVTPEPRRPAAPPAPMPSRSSGVPEEFLRNMDRALARAKASGEKLAEG